MRWKKKYTNVILTEIHRKLKKTVDYWQPQLLVFHRKNQEKIQQNTVKPNSQLPVVFCGSPLCWRVEPVFKLRTDSKTLMLCCMLLYLKAITV